MDFGYNIEPFDLLRGDKSKSLNYVDHIQGDFSPLPPLPPSPILNKPQQA